MISKSSLFWRWLLAGLIVSIPVGLALWIAALIGGDQFAARRAVAAMGVVMVALPVWRNAIATLDGRFEFPSTERFVAGLVQIIGAALGCLFAGTLLCMRLSSLGGDYAFEENWAYPAMGLLLLSAAVDAGLLLAVGVGFCLRWLCTRGRKKLFAWANEPAKNPIV